MLEMLKEMSLRLIRTNIMEITNSFEGCLTKENNTHTHTYALIYLRVELISMIFLLKYLL